MINKLFTGYNRRDTMQAWVPTALDRFAVGGGGIPGEFYMAGACSKYEKAVFFLSIYLFRELE